MSSPTPQSTKPQDDSLSESVELTESKLAPPVVSMYNISWDMICPHCSNIVEGRDIIWSDEHEQTCHQACGNPITLKLFSDDLSQMAADILNRQALANIPKNVPYLMNEYLESLSKKLVLEDGIYVAKSESEIISEDVDRAVEESDEEESEVSEAQRQGTDERVARRTRLPKVTPPDRSEKDLTPRRDADNSPMQTSRGKASVRRQGKRNKKNAASFKRYAEAIEFFKAIDDEGPDEIAERVNQLSDPVSATKLAEIFAREGYPEYTRIAETIRNVFEGKSVELLGSVCQAGVLDAEILCFEEAQNKGHELKEWGVPFVWLERVEKRGAVIYKAVGDYPPSTLYEDRRGSDDRIILPLDSDKAKIIEIVYGDQ